MSEMLRTELHCHNIYSNGHVGDLEPPCDCNVTISEQLEKSLDSKLDVLFVTNHNTLAVSYTHLTLPTTPYV